MMPPLRKRLMVAGAMGVAVGLALYFPDRGDGSGAVFGGIFAFAAVAVGLAAVERARPLPRRSAGEHLRLFGTALAIGVALGLANLLANYGIARLDSSIRLQMIEQWAHFSAWSVIVAGPMIEEIAYRLVLMGGIGWLVLQRTDDVRVVFFVALAVSALLFGVAHVIPSSRPTTGPVHAVAVAVKSAVGGLVLGWVFWRKGLPYSIACHGTANAVHLVAAQLLF